MGKLAGVGKWIAVSVLGVAAATFGAAAIVVGYAGFKLGQVERLEVAASLTAPTNRPVTAADVVRDGSERTDDDESGGASGGATGSSTRSQSGGASGGASGGPLAEAAGDGFAGDGAAGDGAAGGLAGDPLGRDGRAGGELAGGELAGGQNFLIVGTDSIEGIDPDDPLLEGRYGTHLADVIMVLRLRPDRTAALMSVPRDLLVTVAGSGTQAKINSAYNFRSDKTSAERAARLIDTIEGELGIGLQHYVEVDLDGFRKLADALGGVEMTFEHALRDRRSGFFTDPGFQVLDGDRSLAYVRARTLESFVDGRWQSYGGRGSDLSRNARQRDFAISAAKQLAAQAGDLTKVRSWLDVAADNVATSDTINIVTDGLELARDFAAVNFDRDVEQYSLSVRDSREQGPVPWSLNLLANDANRRVLDVFRGIRYDDVVEWRVRVEVTGPQASRVAAGLRGVGFEVAFARQSADATAAAVKAATSDEAGEAAGEGAGQAAKNVLAYGNDSRLAAALVLSHLPGAEVKLLGVPSLGENTVVLYAADELEVSDGYVAVDLPPRVAGPAIAP